MGNPTGHTHSGNSSAQPNNQSASNTQNQAYSQINIQNMLGQQVLSRSNAMDQVSINQVSSKHMTYNQMMIALGKGRKVDIAKKLDEQQRLKDMK
jgi:hypothetical protein